MKKDKDVSIKWGYGQSGANGKHISGQTYEYDEDYFTRAEAKRDAKLKLKEKYPGVTKISVSVSSYFIGSGEESPDWRASAEGVIKS